MHVSDETKERGRSPSLNPTRPPIDNTRGATATSFAPHHLHPPHPPLQRSSSTGTRSVSSRGSSSTNITSHSNTNKVTKRPPVPKIVARTGSERKTLWCPYCRLKKKNAFDKHFRDSHISFLLRDGIDKHDSIGCGYCQSYDLLGGYGKVYHGVDEFVTHVKDEHTSDQQLHWDFNASFNHTLIAQEPFRRSLMTKIQRESQNKGVNSNSCLTLSWARSPTTEALLRELQIVSGAIDHGQPIYHEANLGNLLQRVYDAASHNWQHPSNFANIPQANPPLLMTPRMVPQPQPQPPRSPNDTVSFAGIGGFIDAPTTPNYAHAIHSPGIVSPSTSIPPQRTLVRRPIQQSHTMNIGSQNTGSQNIGSQNIGSQNVGSQNIASSHATSPVQHVPFPGIAFDGHPAYPTAATPPSQQFSQEESLEGVFKEWGLQQDDLYNL